MKAVSPLIVLLFCSLLSQGVNPKKHSQRVKKKGNKIVGGAEVNVADFPYQAHLNIETDEATYGCGGSVIGNNYILTAAHCLEGAKKVFVRVGSEYAQTDGEVLETDRFKQHPKYNPRNSDYDVGIVFLVEPLTYGSTIQPVTLPNKRDVVLPGTDVTVSGWGTTEENGDASVPLMAVTVQVIPYRECRKSYRSLTRNMLCAGVREGGKDSCQGDSGGPAVITPDQKIQIGVVSYGAGCARPGYPGVYSRLASPGIRDWIQEQTGV